MILARIFTKIYKESGIILIDSKKQKYICGNPRKDNPITVKHLKENKMTYWEHWKFSMSLAVSLFIHAWLPGILTNYASEKLCNKKESNE